MRSVSVLHLFVVGAAVASAFSAGCTHTAPAVSQPGAGDLLKSRKVAVACVQPPANMVSWWPGDGNGNDIVGSNPGTLINGVTFATGKVSKAFVLDGVGQYVDAGNAPSLHVSSGDFTVDAWVRFKALSHPPGSNKHNAPPGDMSIADKMRAVNGVPNVDGWRLLKQNDNHFWFCLGGGSAGNTCGNPGYTVVSTTVATVGTWYLVAAVKTSTTFSIYVNGVQQASQSTPAFTDTNTTHLLIGSNVYEGADLNGKIDEVELFNRALSSAEILSIFKAGAAGKCKP